MWGVWLLLFLSQVTGYTTHISDLSADLEFLDSGFNVLYLAIGGKTFLEELVLELQGDLRTTRSLTKCVSVENDILSEFVDFQSSEVSHEDLRIFVVDGIERLHNNDKSVSSDLSKLDFLHSVTDSLPLVSRIVVVLLWNTDNFTGLDKFKQENKDTSIFDSSILENDKVWRKQLLSYWTTTTTTDTSNVNYNTKVNPTALIGRIRRAFIDTSFGTTDNTDNKKSIKNIDKNLICQYHDHNNKYHEYKPYYHENKANIDNIQNSFGYNPFPFIRFLFNIFWEWFARLLPSTFYVWLKAPSVFGKGTKGLARWTMAGFMIPIFVTLVVTLVSRNNNSGSSSSSSSSSKRGLSNVDRKRGGKKEKKEASDCRDNRANTDSSLVLNLPDSPVDRPTKEVTTRRMSRRLSGDAPSSKSNGDDGLGIPPVTRRRSSSRRISK